jgi:hypothetical protein
MRSQTGNGKTVVHIYIAAAYRASSVQVYFPHMEDGNAENGDAVFVLSLLSIAGSQASLVQSKILVVI